MLRSQNVKGYLKSTPKTFTRVSFFLLLLAVSALGLATISVSSHSARHGLKSNASAAPVELRPDGKRELLGRGRNSAGQSANLASGAGANLSSPMPLASTIDVDRSDDNASASACTAAANDCSLRGAIAFANLNPGTTINIPAGTYQLTIAGPGEGFSGNNSVGDLDVTGNNTTIVGAGTGSTIIRQTTANDRVIEVNPALDPDFNFSIANVTITGGKETTGVGGGGMVGGSQGNRIVITNCVFSNNSATGAGTAGGGAISYLGGNLTITGSTFDGNSTDGSGGAVSYSAGDPFGRTPSSGTLNITGSTFTNNSARSSSAGGGALEVFNYNGGLGTYQVSGSSFSGNSATQGNGGAIIVESGPLTLSTSSLASNQAGKSGGAIYSSGSLSVAYSRLVGNSTSDPTKGLSIFRIAGPLSADDNWWGSNAGPSVNDVRIAGPNNSTSQQTLSTWLILSLSASPSSVCANQSTTLTADIKSRNTGSALTTELNGLPAFPVPGTTIFSNAVLGTLSAASTQFVNGVATATYTAGNTTGTGSADASVDNQSPITTQINIDKNTTSHPADQAVCEGGTATFTTTASGNGPFTFVWKKGATTLNNGDLGGRVTITSNGNTSTLSISNAQSSDAGSYTVESTGACNTDSQTASLSINQSTTTTALSSQTVCAGATASFNTTASGAGPFTFVWKKGATVLSNGGNITINTSTTSSTISISNAQAADAGTYTVEVQGACNTDTQSATLTVNASTSATTPNDETVCQGATANFSTTASGTGPFSYQWRLDGSNIAGANGSSLSLATSSVSVGNHTVDVIVNGACGSVTKNASLTVQENTSATAPADQTICQGATASFSTTASGTGPFSYQWKLDGSNIAGANGSSVSIPTGSLSTGNHTVEVDVSGTCGSASRSATLTVQENTSATAPADQTVCQGATASFSTTASGTGPFTYQWKLDGSNIAGANGSSDAISTGSLSTGNHTVEVVVSGACGSVTKSASLTVQENTSATASADQTVCQGATANFSTIASGTGPFTYQWKLDGSNIAGANGSSVSISTSSATAGNHTVEVVVSGACGTVTKSATLTVNTAPVVTTNPVDLTVTSGNATFTAAASGSPTPTVQWQVSTNGGATFTDIPGATSTTLTFATSPSQNGYKYRAVFTNSCGTATTSAATLTTCTPAAVTSNPQSVQDACVGALVTFTASGSGTPAPTVQWQVSTNGGATFTDIPGATSNTLSVTASVAVRNNQYRAVFTNACGTATSSAATLGVDSIAPVITLNGQSITLWPPDHKYRTIHVADLVSGVSDNCGSLGLNNVVISQVTSDEPEDDPNGADGATLNDIVIAPDCRSVQLRAERDGNRNGRVYTITFKVTDSAGNVGTATAKVFVPKSQNGAGAVDDGPHYTVNSDCQ